MNQARRLGKALPQSQEKLHSKYIIGNSCLYQYKDPEGRTVQITRPAFIKLDDREWEFINNDHLIATYSNDKF